MKVWRGVCPFEIQHRSYLDGPWLYPFLILILSEKFNDLIDEMESKTVKVRDFLCLLFSSNSAVHGHTLLIFTGILKAKTMFTI